ncbi:hypothetical protein SPOG_01737 [Schizosaccharomyces cryophilus OY26]|uniref:Uncharacterized protein n=1 Tax=Schizosaccharomyces cryophilus (strain OY26 / ATCC MYA-4695 / CBS 11777 / NBRC 106824 / NRRL Y48691) TaxID=653667 RepID=S9XFK4_SCHCR|nr:uncharacterized protein SPOG_01737 [Schizosaccharomyces cryophilus OY26]EPY52411.1 hypothetical protein SPOG_01737 [Schizosaccharomyces cryophilus OY26]
MDSDVEMEELQNLVANEERTLELQEKEKSMYLELFEKFKILENINGFLLIAQLIYRLVVFFTILSSPDSATLRLCIYLEFLVGLLTMVYFFGNIVWLKTDMYKSFVSD